MVRLTMVGPHSGPISVSKQTVRLRHSFAAPCWQPSSSKQGPPANHSEVRRGAASTCTNKTLPATPWKPCRQKQSAARTASPAVEFMLARHLVGVTVPLPHLMARLRAAAVAMVPCVPVARRAGSRAHAGGQANDGAHTACQPKPRMNPTNNELTAGCAHLPGSPGTSKDRRWI